jgi:hypothetical protein
VAKETAAEGVAASHAAADEVVAEEAAASRAAADEVVEEAVEEALAGAGTQGSQEIAACASSDAASEPGAGTGTPVLEEKTGEGADLICAGADAGPS